MHFEVLIVFHQLERNDLVKIVDLEMAKVIDRVRAKDIKVHLDTTAVEFLIDKGFDPTYGARPMRRAVEKYLEDPLAEDFLRGNIIRDSCSMTSSLSLLGGSL